MSDKLRFIPGPNWPENSLGSKVVMEDGTAVQGITNATMTIPAAGPPRLMLETETLIDDLEFLPEQVEVHGGLGDLSGGMRETDRMIREVRERVNRLSDAANTVDLPSAPGPCQEMTVGDAMELLGPLFAQKLRTLIDEFKHWNQHERDDDIIMHTDALDDFLIWLEAPEESE